MTRTVLFSETHSTAQKNRAPENRSEARFLGKRRSRLAGRAFCHRQNADRITKSKQRGPDRKRVSHHICCVKALANTSVYWLRALPCMDTVRKKIRTTLLAASFSRFAVHRLCNTRVLLHPLRGKSSKNLAAKSAKQSKAARYAIQKKRSVQHEPRAHKRELQHRLPLLIGSVSLPYSIVIYPLAIATHPERAHFAMDWGGEAAIPTVVLQ